VRLPFALPAALFISAKLLQVKAKIDPHSANDSPGETTFPSGRSRITPARVAWVMERLGPRDLAIIQSLARVRVASAQQLQRLHFFSSSPLSNARSARATLARLAQWRVLSRLERRVGGVRSGSASYVYALDGVGQRILDGARPIGGSRFRRPWTPSVSFVDHTLAVTELYVRLVEAERDGLLQVLAFDAEPACWRSFNGSGGEVVMVKPDAYSVLGVGEFEEHAFIEVDRGTESSQALRVKFDRYRAYWVSGREQRTKDVFPRVVWLVPDSGRQRQLVDIAGRQPAEAWQLFKVGLFEDAVSALTGGGDG
jgi:hypothetical protein